MALVLCTGVHSGFTHTRGLILQAAGHTVITVRDESSLKTVCQQLRFDVAVVSQTGLPQIERWLALIRKYCPSAKVLEVYARDIGIALKDADDWLESTALEAELATRVSSLAGEGKIAAAALGIAPGAKPPNYDENP